MEFKGTVLIVSHDRAFLDNVVTSTLVFDGTARVREYVGGFEDWLSQGGCISLLGVTEDLQAPKATASESEQVEQPQAAAQPEPSAAAQQSEPQRKLSYNLQRELDAIPGQIESLETELESLHEQISQSDFYQQSIDKTEPVLAQVETVQAQLDVLIERWAELES